MSLRLNRLWKTKEFYLTIAGLRANGQFKLTLWAAREQCRLRFHEHMQRLRHLYSLSDPGMDPEVRERWSKQLLGFGAQRARRVSSFPCEPRKYADLTDVEKNLIHKSKLQTELRREADDLDDLNDAFSSGSWVCSFAIR